MNKKLKNALMVGFVMSAALSVSAFTACTIGGEDTSSKYSITIGSVENGSINVDVSKAEAGQQVTITVNPDAGYRLYELYVNEDLIVVENGTATFEMPEGEVVIYGSFEESDGCRVTLGEIKNGSVRVSASTVKYGQDVNLTITPNIGYEIDTVTVNGTPITAVEGAYSFKMPDEDVTVDVTFKMLSSVVLQSAPAENMMQISATAPAGSEAQSVWTAQFGDDAVEVKAYVKDGTIIDRDSVELYVGLKGYANAKLSENNLGIKISANGTVEKYKGGEENYSLDPDANISGSFALWTEDSETVSGYIATISIPYTAMGVDSSAAKGNITILPVLNNIDKSTLGIKSEVGIAGGSIDNPGSYAILNDDNTYVENDYVLGYGQLGDGNGLVAAKGWDTSKDYASEDANYANREVVLTEMNGDNNIVFYRSEGETSYAKATFKVDSINNGEQWGKFGLMLFDGEDKKGVFFYVDAFTGDTSNDLSHISGTGVGYNAANGAYTSWNGISGTDNSYDKTTNTITLAMTYHDSMVFMYVGDKLVGQVGYSPAGNVAMGIKSFNYGLTVTDYYATNDIEDEQLKAHLPTIDLEQVDVLFCGDSYMDFWKAFGGFEDATTMVTTKADIGIGGTMIEHWDNEGKITAIKKQYNPSKIVFHISVNDIDNGQGVDPTVEELKNMYNSYHNAFPQAQLYWVSLVPNTMFKQNVGIYNGVNAGMKEYCESIDWLTYIDVTTALTAEDGTARVNMSYDGLHFNTEYGYPLWSSIILKALGYERENGTTLGDSVEYYAYSNGWSFSADGSEAVNTLGGEQAIYYNGFGYSSDLLFEAEIYTNENYNNDQYPKAGLMLRNDQYTIFAYVDLIGNNRNVSIVYRPNVVNQWGNAIQGEWQWGAIASIGDAGKDCTQEFVKLGIAKYGANIYLLVNGEVKTSLGIPGVDADMEFVAGVLSFNRRLEVKNASGSNEADTVRRAVTITVNDGEMDGVLDESIWTAEVLANKKTSYALADGSYFEWVGVKGTDGIYFATTIHTGANNRTSGNWWENLNVEFRFGGEGDKQRVIWFDGVGFENNLKYFGGIKLAGHNVVEEGDGKYAVTVEFMMPYSSLANCDVNTPEIDVRSNWWVCGSGLGDPFANTTFYVSEHGIRAEYSIVKGEYTGLNVDCANKALAGDSVTITVTSTDPDTYKVNALVVKSGENNVSVTDNGDGTYTFVMPETNVSIEISLKDLITINMNDVTGKVVADKTAVTPGTVVTFSETDNYSIVKLYANGDEIVPVDGVYSVTINEETTITGEFNDKAYGIVLNGVEKDIYGTTFTQAQYNDDRSITVKGAKTENGVYLYAKAIMNTYKDNSNNWFENTNIEFYLNYSGQYYVNAKGDRNGATASKWISTYNEETSKWEHIVELFVPKTAINNFDGGDIVMMYAWKTLGEVGYSVDGLSHYTSVGQYGDWLATHRYGGLTCNDAGFRDVGINGYNENVKIGVNGLYNVVVEPKHATMDGDLTEYAGKNVLSAGNDNMQMSMTGFTADDGLYLAFTLVHGAWSTPHLNDWAMNDNIELRINNTPVGISFMNGNLMLPAFFQGGAAKTVDIGDGKLQTTVELFLAGRGDVEYRVQVGCNGEGFKGWQSLIWDLNNAFVSANGAFLNAAQTWGAPIAMMDGVLNEDLWTAEVQANAQTDYVNGAEVKVMGVKRTDGIFVATVIKHSQPIDHVIQGDGTQWWNFLNIELRVNNGDYQIAGCPFYNGFLGGVAGCCNTVDNGDGTYTTTIEVFLPYVNVVAPADMGSRILLCVGGVYETGFAWLFGGFRWQFEITENGLIAL